MYKDNATWRMLEKSKAELQLLINDINNSMHNIPTFMRHEVESTRDTVKAQHNKLVKLQLKLEDKLCQEN